MFKECVKMDAKCFLLDPDDVVFVVNNIDGHDVVIFILVPLVVRFETLM